MRIASRPMGELPAFHAIILAVIVLASNVPLLFALNPISQGVARIANPTVLVVLRDIALVLGASYVVAFLLIAVVKARRTLLVDEDATLVDALSPREYGSLLGTYGALLALAGWRNFAGPVADLFGMAGKGTPTVAPVTYTYAIGVLLLNLFYLSGLPLPQISWRRLARRRRPSVERAPDDMTSAQQPITAFPSIIQPPPLTLDTGGMLATFTHERDTEVGADGERRWQ